MLVAHSCDNTIHTLPQQTYLCGRLSGDLKCLSFFEALFNRDDVKFGIFAQKDDVMSELQIAASYRLYAGFKKLLKNAEPYLSPRKLEGFQFVPVHRDVSRLIRCTLGDVALPHIVDTMPVRASVLLGWCSVKFGTDVKIIPIAHSVIIASLIHLGVGSSVTDIS